MFAPDPRQHRRCQAGNPPIALSEFPEPPLIEEFAFTPAEIKITRGTKVVWTNQDDEPHTVADATAKKAFKSQALDKGETFSLVFQEAGTFAYFCSLHPHMMGTVVVT
jgi:plastocyanin